MSASAAEFVPTDPVCPADPADLADADLEEQLGAWAGRLAAATAQFLRLLAEFDQREGWAGVGVRSCAHWLSWRCGMSLSTTRDHVRVARRLRPLPVTSSAFADGRLSYSKVRAICRVATPATESDLVDLASCATACQVERVARTLPTVAPDHVPDPDGPKPAARDREPRLRWRTDQETGRTYLSGWLEPEDAALVLSVLRTTAEERNRLQAREAAEPRPDDPLQPDLSGGSTAGSGSFSAVVVADAFAAAAQGLERIQAEAGERGAAVAARPAEVVVHVDAELLTRLRAEADRGSSRGHLEEGPAVSLAVIEQLACDGAVRLTTHGSDGRTLDLGRRRRRPTRRQLDALLRRDGGCSVPGCERIRFLHAHHVVFWSRGGRTVLDNLVLLCGEHHRALHDGAFAIEALGRQRFRYRDRVGCVVAYAPGLRGRAAELASELSAGDPWALAA